VGKECGTPFKHHLLAALLVRIPGGIADNHHASGLHTPQCLAEHDFIVFSVMKRRIEYDSVELTVLKRQMRKLCLNARKELGQMASIVLCCA
jgi:hypothetical protein